MEPDGLGPDDAVNRPRRAPVPSAEQTSLSLVVARVESALGALTEQPDVQLPVVARLVARATTALEELLVADEELRAQTDELVASRDVIDAERERYADLFEAIPDAVIETDRLGRILEANAAAAELLGVTPRVVQGKIFTNFVQPAHRSKVRGTTKAPSTAELLFVIQRRDGTARQVAAHVREQEHGDVGTLLWVIRDLSTVAELHERAASASATAELCRQLASLHALEGSSPARRSIITRVLAAAQQQLAGWSLAVQLDGEEPISVDELATELATTETRAGDGPLGEAVAGTRTVVAVGVEVARRWPVVGHQALSMNASAVTAAPIVVDGEPVGAVAAWLHDTGSSEDVLPLLTVLADHLSTALANMSLVEHVRDQEFNLRRALETRGAIERAKGMLMQASGVTSDEAFELLRQRSQHSNRKLRDVAIDLTEGRSSPAAPVRTDQRPPRSG